MKHISIRRPNESDIEELQGLFEVTIIDTLKKEGIDDNIEGIKEEIAEKNQFLGEDLQSSGVERFFLIACCEGKIIGTIAYGPCGKAIKDGSDGKLNDVGEIGTAFVLPKHQNKGIGTLLLNSICIALLSRNIEDFCLDSGYARAKVIWRKKLGEPNIIVKDYWGEGYNHMIWHRKLRDMQINYKIY